MDLSKAQKIANTIVATLQPHCEIINIAGSIRRRKDEVKDIEIVCSPRNNTSQDLWGISEVSFRTQNYKKEIAELGEIKKGNTDGRYMAILLTEGIMLDLFMPAPHDYYRQFACRTGSKDYTHRVIATGWNKIGWCGTDVGLRKITDCIRVKMPNGKSKWKCINPNAEHPPAWTSEGEFFEWIKVKMINPEFRN